MQFHLRKKGTPDENRENKWKYVMKGKLEKDYPEINKQIFRIA